MPRLTTALCILALCCLPARAAENPASGTWEWTYNTKDAKDPTKAIVAKVSVKLVQEGEKLTGAFVERSGKDVPIADGKIDSTGNLSFSVTRDLNGEKRLFKYHGKLDGDTITGKIDFYKGEKVTPHDWEAKRAK